MNITKASDLHQYIERQFQGIPDKNGLLNGHIYYIHLKHGKKLGKTIAAVLSILSDALYTEIGLLGNLNRLLTKIENLKKKLSRNWSLLEALLLQPFKLPSTLDKTDSNVLESPQTLHHENIQTSTVTFRSDCAKCPKLRGENANLNSQCKQQRKDSSNKITEMKRNYNIKVVNKCKRRSADAKRKLRDEMNKLKKENKALQRKVKLLKCNGGQNAAHNMRKEKQKRRNLQASLLKNKCLIEELKKEKKKLKNEVKNLHLQIDDLKSQLEDIRNEKQQDAAVGTKHNGYFSPSTRLAVYMCLLSNVPVEKISTVIKFIGKEMCKVTFDNLPGPSTVCRMAYEIGCISDLQAAEILYTAEIATVSWDATTLDGAHINECHITAGEHQLTLQTTPLAGGRSSDYVQHIFNALQDVACTYSIFSQIQQHLILHKFKETMQSTLSDRAPVNHCVNEALSTLIGKKLVELNCNVHPLDGMATEARKSLRQFDRSAGINSKLYGSEGSAANLLHAVSKLRYKMKSGDPNGFRTFLRSMNLQPGIFVRYVGNRLHVIFHMAGTVFDQKDNLAVYLQKYCVASQLRQAILTDLQNPSILVQLRALGLFGKLLTGPWMTLFYKNEEGKAHLEMVPFMKICVRNLQEIHRDSSLILTSTNDIFDRQLDQNDMMLKVLRQPPVEESLGTVVCLLAESFSRVLERQLIRYLHGDLSEPSEGLLQATSSAPVSNLHAERVLGQFDAQFRRAPNATTGFLDAKVKANTNKTIVWLTNKPRNEQLNIIQFAIREGSRIRKLTEERKKDVEIECFARQLEVARKRHNTGRNRAERQVKAMMEKKGGEDVLDVLKPDQRSLTEALLNLDQMLVGQNVQITREVEGKDVIFTGVITSFGKKRKKPMVTVQYGDGQSDIFVSAFVADIILGVVTFI